MEPYPVHSTRRYKSKSQRPCDFCRRRRAACRILSRPPCELCKAYNQACTFDDAPPPRRPRNVGPQSFRLGSGSGSSPGQTPEEEVEQTAQPVQDHEIQQGLESQAHLEPAVEADDLLDGFFGDVSPGLLLPLDGLMSQVSEAVKGLDSECRLLSGVNSVIGPTDPMDPYMLRDYRYDSRGDLVFKRLTVRRVENGPDPVHFLVFNDGHDVEEQTLARRRRLEELELLVPERIGVRLLLLYFRFVHPMYPVLHQDRDCNIKLLSPTLSASIFLLAQGFVTFDEELCIQSAYDRAPRRELYTFARDALHTEAQRPTFSSLQSGLMLVLSPSHDTLMPENEERVSLMGSVVAMAHSLGLHYNCSSWNIPDDEKSTRSRLACLVCSVDAWMAATMGRPPLISVVNWAKHNVTSSGAPMAFVQFSHLSEILRSILDDIFSIRASGELSANFRLTLQATQPLMECLMTWYREMSDNDVSMAQRGSTDGVVNTSSFLSLGFHAVRTLLFRGILRPFHNHQGILPQLSCDEATEFDIACEQVRAGARTCAASFTDYVRGLGPREMHAFWPFWSLSAFALQPQLWQVLFLSSRTESEAAETRQAVAEARQILRLQARSFDSLRLALLRVDSIWWRGLGDTLHLSGPVERSLDATN